MVTMSLGIFTYLGYGFFFSPAPFGWHVLQENPDVPRDVSVHNFLPILLSFLLLLMCLARSGIVPEEEQGFAPLEQGFALMEQGLHGFLAFAIITPAACAEEKDSAAKAKKAQIAIKSLNLFHILIYPPLNDERESFITTFCIFLSMDSSCDVSSSMGFSWSRGSSYDVSLSRGSSSWNRDS